MIRSLFATAFALLPLAGQDPARVEVIAGPGRPSTLLGEHLEKHREEFVFFDVGLLVHLLAGDDLGHCWFRAEDARHRGLTSLLGCMIEHPRRESASQTSNGLAAVAAALLTGDAAEIDRLPRTLQAEAQDVVAGRRGTLGLLPKPVAHDWADAVPTGAYADAPAVAQQGLFRATVYLHTYLQHLPPDLLGDWQRRVVEALDDDTRKQLQRVDDVFAALFGARVPPMPGLPGLAEQPDRVLLPQLTGTCWQRLHTLYEQVEVPRHSDLRARLLDVAHELATEAPADPLLDALGRERWRCKWLDIANYAYVALRETDALLGVLCVPPQGERPRLLVEPLPRTLAALRKAALATQRVHKLLYPGFGSAAAYDTVQLIDDLAALLAAQQKELQPDAALLDRLWNALEHWFDGEDPRQGVVARVEGIDGGLRRNGVWLVRVPIRWQGQDKTALAFRLFVEREAKPGTWEPPPWGLELRPVAKPVGESPVRK